MAQMRVRNLLVLLSVSIAYWIVAPTLLALFTYGFVAGDCFANQHCLETRRTASFWVNVAFVGLIPLFGGLLWLLHKLRIA